LHFTGISVNFTAVYQTIVRPLVLGKADACDEGITLLVSQIHSKDNLMTFMGHGMPWRGHE
jgi:hypothetical protein